MTQELEAPKQEATAAQLELVQAAFQELPRANYAIIKVLNKLSSAPGRRPVHRSGFSWGQGIWTHVKAGVLVLLKVDLTCKTMCLCKGSSHLIVSTLGLFSPRKNWLLRSVLTTSLSTVNCTFRQNAFCSSGVIESLSITQQHEYIPKATAAEFGGGDQGILSALQPCR